MIILILYVLVNEALLNWYLTIVLCVFLFLWRCKTIEAIMSYHNYHLNLFNYYILNVCTHNLISLTYIIKLRQNSLISNVML